MLKSISSDKAPAAVGPYSMAIEANGFIFCSGQLGLDPASGTIVEGGVEAEAHQVFANINAVLESAGVTLDNVVKATVFLQDMNDFPKVNEIYAQHFGEHKPARSTVEVAKLPKGGLVEIEVIAVK